MICSNCGCELPDSAKFCGKCGSKVEKDVFCMVCGARIPDGNAFCMECGTPVGETSSVQNKPLSKDDITQESEQKKIKPTGAKENANEKSYEEQIAHMSYRNWNCGSYDDSHFSFFMGSMPYLYYAFQKGADYSVLGTGQCKQDETIIEKISPFGTKKRFHTKEYVNKDATVVYEKIYLFSSEDNDKILIKCLDTDKGSIQVVKSIDTLDYPVFECKNLVAGMDGKFYYELYIENNEDYGTFLACAGRNDLIGFYGSTIEHIDDPADMWNIASRLNIIAYNNRYIYLCGSGNDKKYYFVYDVKTGEINDLIEMLPEKHREKKLIGIDAGDDQILLAKDPTGEWENFDPDGIHQNFITVHWKTGKETDWHTETMENEHRGEYYQYAAFDNNRLIYSKVRTDDYMGYNDAGEYVYLSANSGPFGVITYDSDHKVKNEWLVDGRTESNCSGLVMCSGGHIMRLWINDPITGEPLKSAFWGEVEFKLSDQQGQIRPQCGYGEPFRDEDAPRMLDLYNTMSIM